MANGDQIFVTYESDWARDPANFDNVNGTGPFKVVGGTGEFENAVATPASPRSVAPSRGRWSSHSTEP
jgi:hypothetical protein